MILYQVHTPHPALLQYLNNLAKLRTTGFTVRGRQLPCTAELRHLSALAQQLDIRWSLTEDGFSPEAANLAELAAAGQEKQQS